MAPRWCAMKEFGKGCILLVIGIPLPIIILLYLFGVLN